VHATSVESIPAVNEPLALAMLVHGHRYSQIARFAGFPSVQAVGVFARRDDVRLEVRRQLGEQARRLSGKALVRLERVLDAKSVDARVLVPAIRTALEVGTLIGFYREPVASKRVEDLTAGELAALIRQTRDELNSRQLARAIPAPSANRDLDASATD